MTLRHLIATASLLTVLVVPVAADGATNDKPTTGKFTGEHSLDGPITLTFERRGRIGLHLGRYSVKGRLRCPDGETFTIDHGGIVTAKTAARVKPNRTFRLSTVNVKLEGRFMSARRVEGRIMVRNIACSQEGTFRATRG